MATTRKPIIHPRSAWTRTTSAASPQPAREIAGVAVHYPGAPGRLAKETDAQIARRLESYRVMHTRTNGWKDIAYNIAVDARGNLWTLRGVSRQPGANGTGKANRSHGAILALVGNDEEPTAAMVRGIQYAIRLYDVRYPGQVKAVRPHCYFVSTSCPGKPLLRLLNDGHTLYVSGARRVWPDVKA